MTTSTKANNKTNRSVINNNLTQLTTIIRTATTSRGELVAFTRKLCNNITGRKTIACAADVLINELRETLAIDKGFKDFNHYTTALQTRIDAKATGAKNELKNAKGIKVGTTERVGFYDMMNYALNNSTSNKSVDGWKLTLVDNESFIVEKRVKKVVVTPVVKAEGSENDSNSSDSHNNKDDNVVVLAADNALNVSPLQAAIEALQALSKDDMQTLASVLVNGSNNHLEVLSDSIKHCVDVGTHKLEVETQNLEELAIAEISYTEAAKKLKAAEGENAPNAKIVKLRNDKKKAAQIVANHKNVIHMEASQY